MELSQFYNPSWKFCKLVVLTRIICFFLIYFFLNFIFQYWIEWELGFIIIIIFLFSFYKIIMVL
jgi:hypothetical protein